MKIFITYASAGAGHFKAAQALYNQFKKNNLPNLEVKLIDILDYSTPLYKISYIYGYTFMITYATWLWAVLFYLTSVPFLRPLINCLRFINNSLNTFRFRKLIIEEDADFIISTHFLPSELVSYIKKSGKIKSRLLTVITDFGVHPFWLAQDTYRYIVACELTKQCLIGMGISEQNIMVLGIPIASKFQATAERSILFKKFNLDERKFSILIVTGSFGIGPIEKIVDLLYQDVQILVVCARNKKLFARLQNKNYPNTRVFGFVDNIEELMSISDVIITKPGGLTISEVLAMELVPVFISAIPGQEAENVRILDSYGIGEKPDCICDVKRIVLDYQRRPEELNRIKENIRRIKKPFAAEDLYHVVCESSAGPACRRPV